MQTQNHQPDEQTYKQKTALLKGGFLAYLIPAWLRNYQKTNLLFDVLAGVVVGILVIPQSLGYAVLAGLPPEYGLYAAIVPVLVYAWVGSSNVQAVGPVAITAIMTASSLAAYADKGVQVYASMASLLAVMVGVMLWLAGRMRLGWIIQFISRGVSSGFISGAAVLIFISQLKYFTGVPVAGQTLIEYVSSFVKGFGQLHVLTLVLGVLGFVLLWINRYGKKWLWQSWLPSTYATWAERLLPLFLVVFFIVASVFWQWSQKGVRVIENIPSGLPSFTTPFLPNLTDVTYLLPTAALMALIIFVSSSSVAGFYARKRNETFDANKELRGLGLANLTGGFFQSFAIAGGFSRTAINADSGVKTPFASLVTTLVMVLALLFLGQYLSPLPYTFLGAIIMVSTLSLMDYKTFFHAWKADRLDAISLLVTFFSVLLFGLNTGLVIGLLVSFAGLIWQWGHPHTAIVGVLEGTEHFRNINRHDVQTFENLLIMRVDESLFFGNSKVVQNQVMQAMREYPKAHEVVLMMSAVNHIDLTAQEMLIALNRDLISQGKRLHYSVIKGPVMDVISQTEVITELSGYVFLSTTHAVNKLKDEAKI